MTATTYTHIPGRKTGTSTSGWLSKIFWRIVEAREKQVHERIARHFAGQDMDYLVRLGYSPSEVARIRRG